MNRNLSGRGLAVGAILIILLAVLYYLSSGGPAKIGPSGVTGPGPPERDGAGQARSTGGPGTHSPPPEPPAAPH